MVPMVPSATLPPPLLSCRVHRALLEVFFMGKQLAIHTTWRILVSLSFLLVILYLNYTEDEQDNVGPLMAGAPSLVYLYTARDAEAMSMKQNVAPLKDVLGKLSTLYSPIKSDCIDYSSQINFNLFHRI